MSGVLFVQIAEDRFGPLAAAERGGEQALGEPGRQRPDPRHDSSLPSSPCQRRSRLRRDARIAASPAWVTVK